MNQEVASRATTAVDGESTAVEKRTPEEDFALVPAVDIFENAQGITVIADMPGVAKDRLNIQADRNALLIEGEAMIDMPQQMEAVYADVHSTRYRRTFVLSSELDADRIEASLKDGVLTVRIPKRAEFRPRKIDVSVG